MDDNPINKKVGKEGTMIENYAKMLRAMGLKYSHGQWRTLIETNGPPVVLAREEIELNKLGGRPWGKSGYEAVKNLRACGCLS